MNKEKLLKSLQALSIQQGHPGTIDMESVVQMLELRDEKIKDLGIDWSGLSKVG